MPYSFGLGTHFAKPALGSLLAVGARAYTKYRMKGKRQAKVTRRPKTSAGMRPLAFPKLTMQRGIKKDFIFCFDGQLQTSAVAGVYGVEDVFKLNDPFDPAVGAATNQPLYWDQWTGLYSRYRVHSATVEVRWMTTDTANITACAIKIAPSDDGVTIAGKDTAFVAEMPLTNTVRISPGGEHTYLIGPRKLSMIQIEGENWYTRANDYMATTTASPAASPRLRLSVANLTGTTMLGAHYHVRITYHVHLFEPVTPPESV